MKTFLARPFDRAGAPSVVEPGSTQDRLNRKFDLSRTPSPGTFLQLASWRTRGAPPEAEPEPSSSRAAAGSGRGVSSRSLAEIRTALEKRSYRAAESLLYAAEASLRSARGIRGALRAGRRGAARGSGSEGRAPRPRSAGREAGRGPGRRGRRDRRGPRPGRAGDGRRPPRPGGRPLRRRGSPARAVASAWRRCAPRPRRRRRAAAPTEAKEMEGLFEATQEIAELLSRREGQPALQRLNQATARFGDRPELSSSASGSRRCCSTGN